MALYRSVYEAIGKSLFVALRDGYVLPSMGSLLQGSKATDESRLSILEMHGQAGLVLAQIERLPQGEQAMAWLVYGKDALPRNNCVEMAGAMVPTLLARMQGGTYGRRVLAMLVLRSCGYRGFGVRRIAAQCSMGWKDIDSLARRVNVVADQMKAFVQAEVEERFRERGWIE